MASIRERTSSAGVTTFAVLYRRAKRQTSTTFHDREQAERFVQLIDLLGVQRAEAELEATDEKGPTVDELFESFIAWKADDVTPRTIRDYRRDYTNWIQPHLGDRRAESIDETDVQDLVDLMKRTLDPKSVADRHLILHSMFRYGSAKTRQLVSHNPCRETELPRRKKKRPKGVTLTQWYAIHEASQRVDPDAADLLLFIAATGWRWSEATALLVGDVEEWQSESGTTHMYATVGGVFRRDEHARLVRVQDEAKSEAGLRRVVLPEACAAMVRRRIVGKPVDGLVLTNAAGRKWYQSNFLDRTWTKILDNAGIKPPTEGTRRGRPTPHWLRHTHVAMLDRSGATLPEMRRRVGHEDIQTTINVYGGMIDELPDDTLRRLNQMLLAPRPDGDVVAGEVLSAGAEKLLAELD